MENISWIYRVRNERILHRAKKDRKVLHTIKRFIIVVFIKD